ncbi:dephospho-CoA kinase [Streptococcus mutans ST1]|nr:dephospho-CoA kinase [Streptococcus mutans ST1]
MPVLPKTMTKIIGIAGGIASGKSTITNYLRQKGYQVIDADQVVHDLQANGGRLYQALVNWLGTAILNEAGELNRPKLSQFIFSSPDNLAKSSQLQNAIIRQELETRRDQLAKTEAIFFMDIPLLIEQNYRDWFDEIWLIAVSPETQIKRLKQRNGYSQEEAQQRLASQMPLQSKKVYADQIIDNNKTVENTKMQVDSQLRRLQNE